MNTLAIAFHGEGPTDWRFFRPLIERLITRLLHTLADEEWEVLVVDEFQTEGDSYLQKVHSLCNQLKGYHMLILHRDGTPSFDEVRQNHFNKVFQDEQFRTVEFHFVPLIPVKETKETEAWMLADNQWLTEELKGLGGKPEHVNLPGPGEIESIADPKQRLEQIIREANAHRSRRQRKRMLEISFLYESAGSKVRIEALKALSAFQEFEHSLRQALQEIVRHRDG